MVKAKERNQQLRVADEALDLLQALDVMDAGDLANSVDDSLKVLQVGDFEDYVDVGLSVFGACRNVTDIGVSVADDGGNLF
jgi:hypothetical protein